ncbi:MAG TPA: hypothetical protein EYP25_10045 [Anaerolineae bacterium]|nr:hypothetical protein [Anaerolineae bacterium]HIQ11943.1 hypothetical protein [Caldilineales bacterium]
MPAFTGFRELDFRTNVRGTHWRHRRALGGELRKGLRAIYGRHYETWGAPGVNCIHIARRAAYRFPPDRPQAFLFVAAQPSALRWGLRIQGDSDHWRRFRFRLEHDPATLTMIVHLLSVYPLTLTDLTSSLGGALGGCWRFENDELTWLEACTLPSASILNDIPFRIASLPENAAVDLALYTEIPTRKAVAWGKTAAERLLPILLALIPLYEMCVDGLRI